MKCFKCMCFTLILANHVHTKGLDLQFSWSKVNYTWSNDNYTNNLPNAYDTYTYENNVPMGANTWRNKVFITVPRRRGGIPSTLNYVWRNETQRHNVPLTPYPDWNTNRMNVLNDSKVHLVSTYRTVVDECDRLWVIDDGRIESLGPSGSRFVVQRQSIVVIDLLSNTIIRRYFLKDTDVRPLTSTVNLAVDVDPSSCEDAYVYLPDILGYGLIVYSFLKNDSWRVTHKYFYLESLSSDFHIAGMDFQWMDGIFSIALSEKNRDGFKTAYFHSFAGTHLFSVSTQVLRDLALATRTYHGNDIKVLFNKGPDAQSTSSGLHKPTGILFFALINKNALGCWNIYKKKNSSYVDIVFQNEETFLYPSDVKVYKNEVIAVTNRFPVYVYKGLNYNDTNFWVWISNVYDATKSTLCSRR